MLGAALLMRFIVSQYMAVVIHDIRRDWRSPHNIALLPAWLALASGVVLLVFARHLAYLVRTDSPPTTPARRLGTPNRHSGRRGRRR